MDRPPQKGRRNSILKVRQTEVYSDQTVVEEDHKQQVMKRRVSFHNVKTVQNYEKGDLNLLDGSPFREKIQETLSSDGILTPGKGIATPTPPSTAVGASDRSSFMGSTLLCFDDVEKRLDYGEVTTYSSADMSICETTMQQAPAQPSTSDPNVTQYGSVDMSFSTSSNISANISSRDDTMAMFNVVEGNKANKDASRMMGADGCDSMMDITTGGFSDDTMKCFDVGINRQRVLGDLDYTSAIPDKTCSSPFPDDTAFIFNVGKKQTRRSTNQTFSATLGDDTALIFDVEKLRAKVSVNQTTGNEPSFMDQSGFNDDTMAMFGAQAQAAMRDKIAAAGGDAVANRSTLYDFMESSAMEITGVMDQQKQDSEMFAAGDAAGNSSGDRTIVDVAEMDVESNSQKSCSSEMGPNSTFVVERGAGDAHDLDYSQHVKNSSGMEIGGETIILGTSNMSMSVAERSVDGTRQPTLIESDGTLKLAPMSQEDAEHSTEMSITSEAAERAPSAQDFDRTINLVTTPDRTLLAAKPGDLSHTINLVTTSDNATTPGRIAEDESLSSMDPTQERSQLLSFTSGSEEKQTVLEKAHDVSEYEPTEIDRRADVTRIPFEDHFNNETMLQSKVGEDLMRGTGSSTAVEDDLMDNTNATFLASEAHGASAMEDDYKDKSGVTMNDTAQTLAATIANITINTDRSNRTINSSINDSLNESSTSRRDISILQRGSRFRPSTSLHEDSAVSYLSLHDETVSLTKRMMFHSHSLQVNYVNPVEDQPQGNLIRNEIVSELNKKLVEMKERSDADVATLFEKLHAVDPVKANAVKNMNSRALSLDDADLLLCGRLKAEIEWAKVRAEVAAEARSAVEALIANDEPKLKALMEDAQLCSSVDDLAREVEALEAELEGLPSAEEALKIIEESEKAAEEEQELDDKILDLEIKDLRLKLELARLKNKELREMNARLEQEADTLERNEAKVQAVVRQILNS
ncbi:hypothetical protein Q1695_011202 [Nippostrongylus brasiliensis]|nr:hypothetical protein Q1695_011202 [Nippostrongylus brasiliensis]